MKVATTEVGAAGQAGRRAQRQGVDRPGHEPAQAAEADPSVEHPSGRERDETARGARTARASGTAGAPAGTRRLTGTTRCTSP